MHSALNKFSSSNILCEVFDSEHRDIKEDYLQESRVLSSNEEHHIEEEEVTISLSYGITDAIDRIDG